MPSPPTLTFIDHAQALDEHQDFDASLDLLYDEFDELFRGARWSKANRILEQIDISVLSVDVMLGVLTATLPAARYLEYRGRLFAEIEEVLAARGQLSEGLLTGLE